MTAGQELVQLQLFAPCDHEWHALTQSAPEVECVHCGEVRRGSPAWSLMSRGLVWPA